MEKQCILLKESVSREQIDYAAYENWWVVSKIIKADPSKGTPEEVIFQTDDDQNFIHYIVDQVGGYPYLIVQGESIEETANDVKSSLPNHSREDVIRMLQAPANREEYFRGILCLGLLGRFKECENETLALFRQILLNKDPQVKIGGIFGMSYSGWPEFRELVQPLVDNDPDSNVRETAARFIEGLNLYPVATG
jgi:hypothetical protein